MPIRRKKVDEEEEEEEEADEVINQHFPPTSNNNNVIGLDEHLTKSPSPTPTSPMNETSNFGTTVITKIVNAETAGSKNDGCINEVSRMLAVALEQIDSVIAETKRDISMESKETTNNRNDEHATRKDNDMEDAESVPNIDPTSALYQPPRTTSERLTSATSSSSNSSSSDESTASDLGVILENEDILTPTSPTTSIGGSAIGHQPTTTIPTTDSSGHYHHQEPSSNPPLAANIFVQQLSLRLADTLNRISTPSNMIGEHGHPLCTRQPMLPRPDPVVAHILLRWLRSSDQTRSPSPSMSTVSCPEYVELQDKLHRLESDRESLSLQVSVLSEQVGAQSDKIKDLESLLDDKRRRLDSTEEMLHDELSTRSGLETDRLDLLSEISQLKLKLAALERDKISTTHRLHTAQSEINNLQRVMQDRYNELITQSQQQVSRTPQHGQLQNLQSINAKSALPPVDQAGEIEQLRSAVQHLMTENAEKEHRIEQMRLLMERQLLRNAPVHSNGHLAGKPSDAETSGVNAFYGPRSGSFGTGTMMGTSALPSSASGHFHQPQPPHPQHLHHMHHHQETEMDINRQLRRLLGGDDDATPVEETSTSMPTSASFPETFMYNSRPPPYPSNFGHGGISTGGTPMQSSASYTSNLAASTIPGQGNVAASSTGSATWSAPVTPHHQQANNTPLMNVPRSTTAARQLAAELNELMPQYRRSPLGFYHTGSLPRGVGQGTSQPKKNSEVGWASSGECRPTARQPKRGLKWLLHLKATSKRSTSAPNLVDSDEEGKPPPQQAGEKTKREKKQKSLKSFISKLKRSNSQEFENGGIGNGGEFRRGGFVRATAGPRLRSWSREPQMQKSVPLRPSVEQFGKWTSEEVADWLNEIGLTMYVADCRRNVRSGRHMMSLTPAEMEKELGIKNQLHRKKLIIAMRNIELGKTEPSDQMDYHQVLRWLDDVGLPQYRDVFAEHRIDGSLLNLLTVDDLLQMRINSALHHATLARGIQILRIIGFNLNRFIRKFNPDAIGKGPVPNQVQLWSQHCVTEWLRTIDLTEFTPNLMCSGIHGALVVLEPTFTAESLAAVLQIPTQKTLLRRHLTTHFNQLLGQDLVAAKRETLAIPFAVQLVPGLKVKAAKKGFSLARRKHNRAEVYMEPDDLVCPLTPNRKPPSSAALLDRLPESISEQMLHSLSASNV